MKREFRTLFFFPIFFPFNSFSFFLCLPFPKNKNHFAFIIIFNFPFTSIHLDDASSCIHLSHINVYTVIIVVNFVFLFLCFSLYVWLLVLFLVVMLLLRRVTGHSGAVTCMIVPQQSQYLLTGSEDTSVILWDMRTLEIKLRIR